MRIFIFVGQFGNEIGCRLLTSMGYSDSEAQKDSYFAIMIDTESKVITCSKRLPSKFHCSYEEVDKRGRGSNWAMGYHLSTETRRYYSVQTRVIELVRRKLEACPVKSSCSFVIIHSLIGGTGGGLGSSIIESLREEFASNHITSITVGPFVSGESPLQQYNTLLTLAWLQRFADCIMIFHNDELINSPLQPMEGSRRRMNSSPVSLELMNESICFSTSNIMYEGLTGDLIHPRILPQSNPLYYGQCPSCNMNREVGLKMQKSVYKLHHQPVHQSIDDNAKSEKCLKGYNPELEIANSQSSKLTNKVKTHSPASEIGLQFAARSKKDKAARISCTCSTRDMTKDDSCIDSTGKIGSCDSDDTNNILQLVTPNQNLKFVSTTEKRTKEITTEYKKSLLSILSALPKSDPVGNKYKNLAAVLVARGNCSKVFRYEEQEVISTINKRLLFCNDAGAKLLTSPVCVPGYIFPQSLTLYYNNSRIADFLEHVIGKATIMYNQSAYLHWYTKFGCTRACFDDAFETLTSVVQEYKAL